MGEIPVLVPAGQQWISVSNVFDYKHREGCYSDSASYFSLCHHGIDLKIWDWVDSKKQKIATQL